MEHLITIEEAASRLGVPKGSLKSAATYHGMLVRMGRAIRIDWGRIEELIEKCQEKPKDRAFTGEKTKMSGSFATPDAQTCQPAQATAAMLKKR